MTADRIHDLRERNNLTQAALSKKLGVTRACVNAWEMGISVPSTPYIVELARLFKVSTDYLLCVDKTSSIDLAGLSETDISIVYEVAKHLRNKNAQSQLEEE